MFYIIHTNMTLAHTRTRARAQTHIFGENHFNLLEKLDNVAHLGVQVKTKSKTNRSAHLPLFSIIPPLTSLSLSVFLSLCLKCFI